jgi:excisionase family DNA binding protein
MSPTNALYVRLPAAEADKLDRAAELLGARKKDLVAGLVSRYVDPDTEEGVTALNELPTAPRGMPVPRDDRLVVGSYSFREYEDLRARPASSDPGRQVVRLLPEVLTAAQAAELLQLTEEEVIELAERGELPGRRLAGRWRFSRVALVASLSPAPQ